MKDIVVDSETICLWLVDCRSGLPLKYFYFFKYKTILQNQDMTIIRLYSYMLNIITLYCAGNLDSKNGFRK